MNIKSLSKNPIFLFFNITIFLALIWPFLKPFSQPERHRLMREKRIALELKTGNTPRQVAQWLDDNRLMFSIYDKGRYRRGNSDNKIPLECYYDEFYYPYKKEKRNVSTSQ